MIRHACLIFVPHSGQADRDRDIQEIRSCLQSDMTLTVWPLTQDIDLQTLAQKAVDRGFDTIIAAGGDGTISAIASVLKSYDIPLGIIPRGTMNALAKVLDIPESIPEACRIIAAGKTRFIDLATCNDCVFVTSVGIGFEAEAIDKTNTQLKQVLGPFAYVASQVEEVSQGWPQFNVSLEFNDRSPVRLHATALTVTNAAPIMSLLAQGGDRIRIDDGQLDVTVFDPDNLPDAIAGMWDLLQTGLQEKVSQHPNVHFWRSRSLTIATQPPQKVVLDGDPWGTTPVTLNCLPHQLRAIVP